MSNDSILLEEERLKTIHDIDDYQMIHERHRIFPEIFENRNHKKLLDISAGVGVVGKRVKDKYDGDITCNDISPKCLSIMENNGLKTVSFDLDTNEPFPVEDKSYDAIISLATIEHISNVDHFVKELHRILKDDGFLYLSAPNYSGLLYLLPVILTGKTFHDPLNEKSAYEFYAHIRYFTYRTLLEYVSSFGFKINTVYLALPKESTNYLNLKSKSRLKAFILKLGMRFMYRFFSPKWASEPVLCFQKGKSNKINIKKRIL